MADDPRTFTLTSPPMHGPDVEDWRDHIRWRFNEWGIEYPLTPGDKYDVAARSATSDLLKAFGVAQAAMAGGVTPGLRVKIRHRRLVPTELARFAARVVFRRSLRRRYGAGGTASPVGKILAHSWGWHPGVHDGVDLICLENAPLYAMCRARVVDVRAGGWWGKNPSGDVSKGDGIIQLEVLETLGRPWQRGRPKKGMHLAYGHAEGATVRVGDIVQAGQRIGHAGLAVAWHVHFMVNAGTTLKGIGDRDPWPVVNYCIKHA